MKRKQRIAAACLAGGLLALLTVPALFREEQVSPVLGPVYGTADCTSPVIALTFDDGPKQNTTDRLLDGLAERGVKATFFLIGCQIDSCKELVLRMEEDGHQIGLHTEDHKMLTGVSHKTFDQEVGKNRAELERIIGKCDYMLRPPYGKTDRHLCTWTSYPLIRWSVDTEDWKDTNRERIVSQIVAQTKDGDIILMHDIYDSSVDAALEAVDCLMEKGYQFVTVEQLFTLRGIKPQAGRIYECLPPGSHE